MSNPVSILGPDGLPFAAKRGRASMLVGGGSAPYDAADNRSDHMEAWNPYLGSPDGDLNMYRDRIVSRVRDMVRNDGWASGAVTRILDNAIGANFRPVAKPDYTALALHTGIKAFDHTWADEYGQALEAAWRTWSNDPGRYCDAQRNLTMSQIFRLGFRHKLIDGDSLLMLHWLPDRIGEGRARYATTVQVIDPDRLSNPQVQFDQNTMRGGVEVDAYSAAVAYHIRKAHQGDYFSAADAVTWERVPRETDWGRPIIIHDFDHERAGQHRGGAGIFSSVLRRLKMIVKYDGAELDASILNAIFGAYIESPFDPLMVEQAMGDGADDGVGKYQDERAGFHSDQKIKLGGARMPILFPGEKINVVTAARPSGNFGAFENAMLRNVAAGTGLSTQQVSNDWSDVNYSSARGAMLEAWKTLSRRRNDYALGTCQPVFGAFVEECMDLGELPLPKGAPSFAAHRAAYTRAKWMGPGRGIIDPVKERQGAILGMDAGLSTLEQECGELEGADWRENVAQRAIEVARFKELGLPLPEWAAGMDAGSVIKEPEAT
ncbi:phage portal protein [Janthinobacterium sp.]|uniref:phage portal protein n=1 Tax=Janthinobacterium sp. TaxID=1871054 RepID=UPI00293D7377|nr:phage portal protein [Janthinobacterium sp.]